MLKTSVTTHILSPPVANYSLPFHRPRCLAHVLAPDYTSHT